MKKIFIYLFLLISFNIFAMLENERLPELTHIQIAGGLTNNLLYWPDQYDDELRNRFAEMHARGDVMNEAELEDIFNWGLFQHYTYELAGISYNNFNKQINTIENEQNLGQFIAHL